MKLALHLDSMHAELGSDYRLAAYRLIFAVLLAQRDSHIDSRIFSNDLRFGNIPGAACETPGAGGLAQSSILLVNTHSPWIADWMPAPEDRRHAERWK